MRLLKKLLAFLSRPAPTRLTREQLLTMRSPPHPSNVPGPFYVENGCCISCGVWEEQAPDLLAWFEDEGDNSSHCYVAKQPETDAEFERMMAAMGVGEVDCIRVHDCRPDWAARLVASGFAHHIDPPEGRAKG